MSNISSVGSSIISSLYSSASKSSKSASSVETLFDQLDSTGKGYLEKSDLVSAFSQISGTASSTSSASVDEVFAKLDSDSDGKVTEDELASGLENLAAALDSQFNQMRMSGGTPPPPPPAQDDSGFTKDELASQLSEIGSSDSQRSELMTKIVNNFDAADTDADGKVSFQEAMAYDESTQAASATSSSETSTAVSTAASSEARNSDLAIMKRIMELMNAYTQTSTTDSNSLASTLSVSA